MAFTESELYMRLVEISGVSDFELELKPTYSKSYWGRYYPMRKLVRLYQLNENLEPYPDEVILKEGLHEVTHHIQHHHIPFWKRKKGIMHDSMFWEIYREMLDIAFDRINEEVIADTMVANMKGVFRDGENREFDF